MMTILFVRHSISTGEPGDVGLSTDGRALAARTASRLRDRGIRRIVSSPLRRSLETAEVFAGELDAPLEVDDRLRERDNWGDIAGETSEAFLARWRRCDDDRDHVPEHGRSARQAGNDLASFVRDVAHSGEGGAVVAISHGGVIVDFLLNSRSEAQLAALNPGYRDMPNCALTQIDAAPDRYVIDMLAVPLT